MPGLPAEANEVGVADQIHFLLDDPEQPIGEVTLPAAVGLALWSNAFDQRHQHRVENRLQRGKILVKCGLEDLGAYGRFHAGNGESLFRQLADIGVEYRVAFVETTIQSAIRLTNTGQFTFLRPCQNLHDFIYLI